MAPKLYYIEASPPARSVLLTAKALDLELELILVNLVAGEHHKPEFHKINPQHTVPAIDDNGYYLWDSHAILTYLVEKYGKDDSLYPKDLQKRGIVDQRLHFNSSILQPRLFTIVRPLVRGLATSIPQEKKDDIQEAYNLLELFLEGRNYFAGDNITIADFSIGATLSSILPIIPLTEKHVRLNAWFDSLKAIPFYQELNQKGADKLVGFIKSKLV